jgi:hypothetical protein
MSWSRKLFPQKAWDSSERPPSYQMPFLSPLSYHIPQLCLTTSPRKLLRVLLRKYQASRPTPQSVACFTVKDFAQFYQTTCTHRQVEAWFYLAPYLSGSDHKPCAGRVPFPKSEHADVLHMSHLLRSDPPPPPPPGIISCLQFRETARILSFCTVSRPWSSASTRSNEHNKLPPSTFLFLVIKKPRPAPRISFKPPAHWIKIHSTTATTST